MISTLVWADREVEDKPHQKGPPWMPIHRLRQTGKQSGGIRLWMWVQALWE